MRSSLAAPPAAWAAAGGVLGLVAIAAFARLGEVERLGWTLLALGANAFAANRASTACLRALMACSLPALAFAWGRHGGELALPAIGALVLFTPVFLLIGQQNQRGLRARLAQTLRNDALARDLAQRNRILLAADRSKSALLAAASHDLRQPAHALGILIELMDPADPQRLRERLDAVRSCADILSDMLTQLLDFNRLDTGLYQPALQPVALDRLLGEVRDGLGAAAEHKGLRLDIRAQPLRVTSDPHLLRRLVFNLVSNAIKFTHEGGVEVEAALHDGAVVLTVSDTGVGIGAQQLQEIFVEYVRTAQQRVEWEEGLGLGLSIVQKGAALLGHDIGVSSELGRGTRFTLRLGAPLAGGERRAAPSGAARRPLRPLPVAVIENDPIVLEGLLDTLRSWGCEPVGAPTLPEMRVALARTGVRPALILSDMHLSGAESGLEAIALLRREFGDPALPAVLVTGDLDLVLEKRARAEGVACAHKPLRPQRLRELISEIVTDGPGPF